jgi:DNA ligase (NAD+)
LKAKEFFDGKKLVITGSFKDHDRVALGELLESFGAKSVPGVTSKVDYLIVGDAPGASKVAAAKKHNIKNVNEEELMSLLKE